MHDHNGSNDVDHSGDLNKILLIGNPNVGKSALFGLLTGKYVTVSNYPGTTVEVTYGNAVLNKTRSLVIDTGMNRKECLTALSASLKELNVKLSTTDFFITHLHTDHLGLAGILAAEGSKIFFNGLEAEMMNADEETREQRWQAIFRVFLKHGFPEEELKASLDSHPGRRYRGIERLRFSRTKDGDVIQAGEFSFRCIGTPGHSPGHTCLYEPEKKLLLSGDHILADITPNITFWVELDNALKTYLESLEKVGLLEVSLVLPGHRRLITDHRARIRELREHHRDRLKEVIDALEEGDKSTFQVAPCISWDIDCKTWSEFPPAQKWFAFGEALAHLKFLEAEGKIRSTEQGGRIVYSLA